MNRLFEDSFVPSAWASSGLFAADLYETDDSIVVQAVIPGIKADDVEINVTGEVLTIRGETSSEQEVDNRTYHFQERRYGSFSRSFGLPKPVMADKAEAVIEDGILTLTLPKAEEAKARAIKVTAK
jgi:HSP20 family protein